jgi:NAD(P)-dependent dehydrogenase (short-subunit alcohol dehydrogenase family)
MAQNTHNNVLVVGGSSGVGLAVAKLALSHLPSSNIIISSSNEIKLKAAVEDISAAAAKSPTDSSTIIDYIVGDVGNFDSQYNDIEAMLKAATARFGAKIDHIVWTAGNRPASTNGAERSHKDLIEIASPRLFGPLTLEQLASKYMVESKYSSITITSGIRVYKPTRGRGRLAAAAGGIEAGTKGLAVDLAPIRVNFVVLGIIQTPLVDGFVQGNEDLKKQLADATLLKCIGSAEEAAEAYLYCMRCAYVTGTRIDVDGGALLC